MNRQALRVVTRVLYTLGILVSLATFILNALPTNWGIFLSSACFIVGAMLWGTWRDSEKNKEKSP